ncbi:MAG: outer membrane protein assembly factor BamA [Lentisphaeria bacterium]|nr:outer membrane protein assembly factor BamA [Lentisphaeria bacterium]
MRIFPRLVYVAIFALGLTASYAFGALVTRISVITPDEQPYSSDVIKANIFTATGKPFSQQALAADIERLYKTGYFQYVDSRVRDVADGHEVVFIVQPLPRVSAVVFEGNEAFSNRRLAKKIDTKAGDLFSGKTVSADTRAILELYADKGYHGTKVTLSEDEDKTAREVRLVWRVEEAPRHKIRKVICTGNTVYSDRQLKKAMVTRRTLLSRLFRTGYFQEDTFEADKRKLRGMYEDKGYLDARFSLTSETKGKWVTLTVTVDEGQPYTVRSLNYAGNKLFSDQELAEWVKMSPGTPYSAGVKDGDVWLLMEKYRPLGYLNVSVRALLDKNATDQTVGVVYQIYEGSASTIRDIRIQGNVDTRDKVIRRELRIQPGDLADMDKLEASKRVLRNLGYFEDVSLSTRGVPGDDSLTDLNITVKEGPTGSFTFGGGFSDTDGFMLTGEVSKSNFDAARLFSGWPPRMSGGGQRVKLSLQAGSEQTNFLFSFVEPWFMDRRVRFETTLFHNTRSYSYYDQTSTGGDVTFTWKLYKSWRQSLGLGIQHITIDEADNFPLINEEGDYWSNSITWGLRRDSRNAFYNPTRGSQVNFRARLAPEALGSYTDIYGLNLTGAKYFPLSRTNTLRLFGQVAVVDDAGGEDAAVFDRLFVGGAGSIRGFRWREVGPVDAAGDGLGGKSMASGSIELIHQFRAISEHLRASLFCDFGNVWEDAYEFDGDINASAGIGCEINLPMGRGRVPIRLDYGWPIHTVQEHLEGSGGRFHFNFGYHY